jgi:hypothetical protein
VAGCADPQELIESLLAIIVRCALEPDAPVIDAAAVASAAPQAISAETEAFVATAVANWQAKMAGVAKEYRHAAKEGESRL